MSQILSLLVLLGVGHTVRFTVLGAEGKPLPGAAVEVHKPRAALLTTDARGQAVLEAVDEGTLQFELSAPKHSTYHAKQPLAGDLALTVVLPLLPLVPVEVVDVSGAPVPGAIVRLWPGSCFDRPRDGPEDEGVTGSDGRAMVPMSIVYPLCVAADHEARGSERLGVEASPRSDGPVRVALRPHGRGLVVLNFRNRGRPVNGLEVRCELGSRLERRVTDNGSSAVLQDLPPGRWKVSASLQGRPLGHWMLELAPNAVLERTFEGELPVALTGRVVDTSGAPVAGAVVTAPFDEVGTGADGTFAFTQLQFSAGATLAVDAPGFLRTSVPLGRGAVVKVVMQRRARLRGRAVDESGHAVLSAELEVGGPNVSGRAPEESVHVDANGFFDAPTAGDGGGRPLSAKGYRTAWVEPVPGDAMQLVTLMRIGSIDVQVTDGRGQPVPQAEVTYGSIRHGSLQKAELTPHRTDHAGRVSLGESKLGEPFDVVACLGGRCATGHAQAGGHLELVLAVSPQRPSRVTGTTPLWVTRVTFRSPPPRIDDTPVQEVAVRQGRFEVELPAGEWEAQAQGGLEGFPTPVSFEVQGPAPMVHLNFEASRCFLMVMGGNELSEVQVAGRVHKSEGIFEVQLPCGPAELTLVWSNGRRSREKVQAGRTSPVEMYVPDRSPASGGPPQRPEQTPAKFGF